MICFCLARFCAVVFLVLVFFVVVCFVADFFVVVFLVANSFCTLAFVEVFAGVVDFALLLDFILRVEATDLFFGSFALRVLSKLISDKKLESVAFFIIVVFGILGVLVFLGLDFARVFGVVFTLDFFLVFTLDFALDFMLDLALDFVGVLLRFIFVLCICMFLFARFVATILAWRFGLLSVLESYLLACRVSA